MIDNNDFLQIDTPSCSLVFAKDKRLKTLYFGKKLYGGDMSVLKGKPIAHYDENVAVSSFGLYDYREPAFLLRSENGVFKSDFVFIEAKDAPAETDSKLPIAKYPETTTLIKYKDSVSGVTLKQYLSTYSDTDAITSYFVIENTSGSKITVERAMSFQLDLWGSEFYLSNYTGNWGRERTRDREKLGKGIHISDSKCGASSSFCNPFIVLENAESGETYSFNLVFSGNHKETVEVTPNGNTRVLVGMNDFEFYKVLSPDEKFVTPQCVFVYGENMRAISSAMHSFVENHISTGKKSKEERPVVFNVWEAMYFDFNTEKALKLADLAAEAGAEVFVLDDGWYGERNDENSSLGDWTENPNKFSGGLAAFADKIRKKGLRLGLWFEPEAVSKNSKLYRAHPEWAMEIPNVEPWLQRNELLLDLSAPDVQDYLIKSVSNAIETYKAEYVKWDFNRLFTEPFAKNGCSGEFFYAYITGLYRVMSEIVSSHENVLFESCASGGARFDLGMLCYMPQVWTSDNTDARDRLSIQKGTLAAYPASTMSAHVSICPNHQTGNSTSIENVFNVASCGLLGYELDLTLLSEEELHTVKEQISFYKKHRSVFQYGKTLTFGNDERGGWIKLSDTGEAIAMIFSAKQSLCTNDMRYGFVGLEPKTIYRVEMRKQSNLREAVCFEASGSVLMSGVMSFGNLYEEETDRKNNSNSIATRLFYIKPL